MIGFSFCSLEYETIILIDRLRILFVSSNTSSKDSSHKSKHGNGTDNSNSKIARILSISSLHESLSEYIDSKEPNKIIEYTVFYTSFPYFDE